MRGRQYVSVLDLSRDETLEVLQVAQHLKMQRKAGVRTSDILRGKVWVMLFEKPSLRTRATFEVAIRELGGHTFFLGPNEVGLGKREPVKDVVRNLARWVDGVFARVFDHNVFKTFREYAPSLSVINALSDLEHPMQALADFQTMIEESGDLGFHLVYIGDGNNVANSLMLLSALLGSDFTIATPEGYEPPKEIVEKALELANKTGARINIVHDPKEAVAYADFIYTDVWASMGQEHEAEERRKIFAPYQVNMELLRFAPQHAKVMHCLPAHRGEEITDDVIESERSLVFEQAENRLHTVKAMLIKLS
ncbi:MAG: ornithine carbamoyltransferase [Thermotogae bacterium]|nr:ornithine carbamoyltransferase [Thermotogota bacterium]